MWTAAYIDSWRDLEGAITDMKKNTEVDLDYRNDCWFGFKDVRARLNSMAVDQEFHFICDNRMAEKIGRIVTLNDGEIFNRDTGLGGVVISLRKKRQ